MRPLGFLLVLALSGCTCGRKQETPPAPTPAASAAPTFDLALHHAALVAYGNSTPLPVSAEFGEEIPAVRPALERAAKAHPNAPLPMRVSRDVPFGQLTRIAQAAIVYRVTSWQLFAEDASGTLRSVVISAPGALPSGRCFARIWVSADNAMHVGLDPGGDSASMIGVVVRPKDGALQPGKALDVVRRLDSACTEGQLRVYTQPTASFGSVFDLALAAAAAPPKVGGLMLGVPSIGPLDSPVEVVP
ncbi:MAG: hypothetical protein ACXVEE_23545 [Polyangiales bacterium]